jgi:hypothetical protein
VASMTLGRSWKIARSPLSSACVELAGSVDFSPTLPGLLSPVVADLLLAMGQWESGLPLARQLLEASPTSPQQTGSPTT